MQISEPRATSSMSGVAPFVPSFSSSRRSSEPSPAPTPTPNNRPVATAKPFVPSAKPFVPSGKPFVPKFQLRSSKRSGELSPAPTSTRGASFEPTTLRTTSANRSVGNVSTSCSSVHSLNDNAAAPQLRRGGTGPTTAPSLPSDSLRPTPTPPPVPPRPQDGGPATLQPPTWRIPQLDTTVFQPFPQPIAPVWDPTQNAWRIDELPKTPPKAKEDKPWSQGNFCVSPGLQQLMFSPINQGPQYTPFTPGLTTHPLPPGLNYMTSPTGQIVPIYADPRNANAPSAQHFQQMMPGLPVAPLGHAFPTIMPSPVDQDATGRLPPKPEPSQPVGQRPYQNDKEITLEEILENNMAPVLAKDENGARCLTQMIRNYNEVEMCGFRGYLPILGSLLRSLLPEVMEIAMHKSGNFVIQDLVAILGASEALRAILERGPTSIVNLTNNPFGCLVIQRILGNCTDWEAQQIVQGIEGSEMDCIVNTHGNHVIQKCLERLQESEQHRICTPVLENCVALCKDRFGCRVVQKAIEVAHPKLLPAICERIVEKAEELAMDPFGNYVVQHILKKANPEHVASIAQALTAKCEELSRGKFSSNVVELAVMQTSRLSGAGLVQSDLVRALLGVISGESLRKKSVARFLSDNKTTSMNRAPIVRLAFDQYGNFLVQKILRLIPVEYRTAICIGIVHIDAQRKWRLGQHMRATVKEYLREAQSTPANRRSGQTKSGVSASTAPRVGASTAPRVVGDKTK